MKKTQSGFSFFLIIIFVAAALVAAAVIFTGKAVPAVPSNEATSTIQTTSTSTATSTIAAIAATTTTTTSTATSELKHCGGNMMNAPTCDAGYHCASAPGSHLPFGDVGGICMIDQGTLSGTMTIGPVCPVESASHPCKPTPEMYAAHKVYVYNSSRQKVIAALTPDAQGNFLTKLDVGTYVIDTEHQSVGGVQGVPTTVKIAAGATSTLKINIDTGIR
jgi:hypothetical protein